MIAIDRYLRYKNHRHILLSICSVKAVSQTGYGLLHINSGKCIKCGKRANRCLVQAFYKQNEDGQIV
jgi:dissimilatory sulfite reductase (desulfoviridin) alpha/beta subunit